MALTKKDKTLALNIVIHHINSNSEKSFIKWRVSLAYPMTDEEFNNLYKEAKSQIRLEDDAERKFFKSHPELNP